MKIHLKNKLCAEFICFKNEDGSIYQNIEGGYPKGTLHFNLPRFPLNTLIPLYDSYNQYGRFDTDWDYLMPLVKEILNEKYCILLPLNGFDNSTVPWLVAKEPVIDALKLADFDKIYNAAIQFIEWYNLHKK
jgi:hypothetical protein